MSAKRGRLQRLDGRCAGREVQPRDGAWDLDRNRGRCKRAFGDDGHARGANAVRAERANPVTEDAVDRIVGRANGADGVAAGVVDGYQAILVATLHLVWDG